MKKKFKPGKEERGCVYFSHLPHGFYEEELRAYLSQFGQVTGVYVPRSKLTKRARGYAFVEFRFPEVALVVADTMNNYLMFNKLVKAEVVPPEKQRPRMFLSKYTRVHNPQKIFIKKFETANADLKKYLKSTKDSLNRQKKNLKNLGFDFEIQTDLPPTSEDDLELIDSKPVKKEDAAIENLNPAAKKNKSKANLKRTRASEQSQDEEMKPTPVVKKEGNKKRNRKGKKLKSQVAESRSKGIHSFQPSSVDMKSVTPIVKKEEISKKRLNLKEKTLKSKVSQEPTSCGDSVVGTAQKHATKSLAKKSKSPSIKDKKPKSLSLDSKVKSNITHSAKKQVKPAASLKKKEQPKLKKKT